MCLSPIQIFRLLCYDSLFCCRHGNSGNSSLLRQVLSLLSKDTDISRQILLPDIISSPFHLLFVFSIIYCPRVVSGGVFEEALLVLSSVERLCYERATLLVAERLSRVLYSL